MANIHLVCAVAGLLAVFYILSRNALRRRLPLPPGPKGHWLSGMMHLLPRSEPWKQYTEWAKDYASPLISYRIYNKRVIVLNNSTAIQDLLAKRANSYSDRPKMWMVHEICARGKSVFNISSLGGTHGQYRRLLQLGLGPKALPEYWTILEDSVEKLIQGIAVTPNDLERHLRRSTTAAIMKITYGYTVGEDDNLINVLEETARITDVAMKPGRWLVDYLPIIRFIPSWVPFAHFKRQGEIWRKRLEHLSDVPHHWVKEQLNSGQFEPSFTSRLLCPDAKTNVSLDHEELIKWCAAGLYVGACDTIVSALISFIHLIALFPTVQARIQSELDEVFGRQDRPRAAELRRLRYLSAVLKEVLRFAPVANLALPHSVTQDDVYAGYRIPKNSTIIPNVWAVMHDSDLFPEPDCFDPDRFLGPYTCPDPMNFAFGFGKRRCPAAPSSSQSLQFAETSLLLHMASILSRFTITTKYPREKIEFTTGITSYVKPFPISIADRVATA